MWSRNSAYDYAGPLRAICQRNFFDRTPECFAAQ
jgi:hypothetical protein